MIDAMAASVGKRKRRDALMRGLMVFGLTLAVIPLAWILLDVAKMGAHALSAHFFTQGPPDLASERGGGAWNGILGTLIMVGLAAAMALPIGILGAIWLVEFSPRSKLAGLVRFFGDVMTGIPSIVFGIFTYTVVVVGIIGHFSAWAGAVALALIMWPVVLRTSEQMLLLVPHELREAAYSLGVPKWRTILKVVLPAAAPGLVTGSMLAVARASGETAPLLFTALGAQFVSTDLSQPMSALPLEIFRGAGTAFGAAQERAWAAALTLIVLVLILALGSRAIAARRQRGITA